MATTNQAGLRQQILDACVEVGALMFGDFTLASGAKSTFYFDGRLLTLSPQGAHLVAQALLPLVRDADADAIGGPTLGADPIVAAVAMASHLDGGRAVPAFIVRKETKDHGAGRLIEGPLPAGSRVAIVDDACSTGASLYHGIRAAEAAGHEVVLVLSILDRHQGGSEQIRADGYRFQALLEADASGQITPIAG